MAYRSSQISTAVTASINATKPAGSVAGDVLIAFVTGGISTANRPITPPSGWTLVGSDFTSSAYAMYIYWAAGDVASTTWTTSSGNADWTVAISAFTGRNTTAPITQSAITYYNGALASLTAASLTAAANDDLVAFWGDLQSGGTMGAISPATITDQLTTPKYLSTANAVGAGATSAYTRSTQNGYTERYAAIVAIAASGGPTVSSVISTGTTEAGNMLFTATLSGATSGSTNYAFALSGTATAGTDYTSPLTSAMCNNGVMVVGSDFVVPTAVSSWTVTIPTTADTTDETNETIILTIGGTASTGGTITDDDPVPAWSVSDAATVTAGSPAIFTISADRASALTQNLTLGFIDGTRVGGTGYDNTITNPDLSNGVTITAGVLTIPAGVTSFTVSVGTV